MNNFHIVLVGYSAPKFIDIMAYVHEKCNYQLSFIIPSLKDVNSLLKSGISLENIYYINEFVSKNSDISDIEYLSILEKGSEVPTIHNMIMSDRIVNKLPYTDGIAYAANLACNFKTLFEKLGPSVVIGGHDGMHSAIGSAVAQAEKIPWFALNFSTIPRGYAAVSTGIIPKEMVCLRKEDDNDLYHLAEEALSNFENKQIKTPAYVSAHNIKIATQRLPEQLKEAFRIFKATCLAEINKYVEYDFKFILKQYVRKKKNMLRLPRKWFLNEPPSEPYVFFGFHMQPESSIDVYAAFYSNQFDTIEKIARSIPPTHKLLVKLHISDADNYSREQLRSLLKLPGVKLVSPNASSREFIENSSAVITIVGTMGLEAALLGKPVLIFGTMDYEPFPSVTRIDDVNNLPKLMRRKLSEQRPTRDSILDAYKNYLKPYFRTTHNDWKNEYLSKGEKNGFVELFQAVEKYLSLPKT